MGRERPHPFPLLCFLPLSLVPPPTLSLAHVMGKQGLGLAPCGTSDKSFVLGLSLAFWQMGQCPPLPPHVGGASPGEEVKELGWKVWVLLFVSPQTSPVGDSQTAQGGIWSITPLHKRGS